MSQSSAASRQPSPPQPRLNNPPSKSVNDVLQPQRPPPAAEPRWDTSFSDYMSAKQQKLRHQYRLQASRNNKSSLFKGVTVWINGVTKVPSPQLRRMLLRNGANIETYCTSLVTHIVASNLATATRLRLQSTPNSKPKPFLVTPQWITDSIHRHTRLPELNYKIPNMSDSRQRTISHMLKRNNAQKVRPAIAKKSRCTTSSKAKSNVT
ncbi:DNA repair protein REV1 [Gracilariopsis chorda]|uniref:DNA repair protein REV1 n=1 Tax=Gracilariopsis chorda TaxID=448386 RepID=A0A2V3J2H3_9FLOR|nr:DNA repair protein REV1 [Gracilariopsis chorda]|eukprot:PXF48574.1 DNA repair protein REV1 [Gracilariopsis chorda]